MLKKSALLLAIILVLLCLSGCNGDLVKSTAKGLDTYTIVASLDDENKILSVVQTFEYSNDTDNTFEQLKFNIYANAYRREALTPLISSSNTALYKYGYDYGGIIFDNVKVDGNDVGFQIGGDDANILIVPLGKTLYPGEKIVVEMVYEIDIPHIIHRLGYGEKTINLGNWYPVLCYIENGEFICNKYCPNGDPFVTDLANYNVTLLLPCDYVVASSGELISSETKGDLCEHIYRADAVRDYAVVLSKDFKVQTRTVGNTAVNFYYIDNEKAEYYADMSSKALEYYNDLYGCYPYSVLNVVDTEFCYGGMEYTGLVYVSTGQEQKSFEYSMVHEIAHQWIYGVVGNNQYQYPWLDEGLVELNTIMFFDQIETMDIATEMEERTLNYVKKMTTLREYKGEVDMSMRAIDCYDTELDYVMHAYTKGSIMYYDLYKLMGEQKFKRCLKKYYDTYKMSMVTPLDMIETFSAGYGADLTEWFGNYIDGKMELLVD